MTSYTPAARTPIHYDYRLDNMLFGGRRPLVVVDWQTVQLGMGPQDVAYFLGNAFEPEVRRSCERSLVERYHRALVDDYGVDDYPFDQCWSEYVRSSYASLLMADLRVDDGRSDRRAATRCSWRWPTDRRRWPPTSTHPRASAKREGSSQPCKTATSVRSWLHRSGTTSCERRTMALGRNHPTEWASGSFPRQLVERRVRHAPTVR